MYRFLLRPTWLLFHAAVLAGVILMTAAGFWQLNRLDERKDFNSEVRGRSQQAPLELTSVLDEIEAGTLDESVSRVAARHRYGHLPARPGPRVQQLPGWTRWRQRRDCARPLR